jgi:hypothetical protein
LRLCVLPAVGRLCEKNQTLNPPRRTGQVYADLRRKKTLIRRLSQKDLLNLREKKNFFASLRLCEKKKEYPPPRTHFYLHFAPLELWENGR